MKKAPTYESTEFDSLNELLDEWKDEDTDLEMSGAMDESRTTTTTKNYVKSEKSDDIVNTRTEAQLFV